MDRRRPSPERRNEEQIRGRRRAARGSASLSRQNAPMALLDRRQQHTPHPHHRRLGTSPHGSRVSRQPYKVGPSRCTVPPVDTYPVRSPLSVSDFLIPRARGKLFCEIGTRNGDIAACVKDAGVDVLVVEIDDEYCAKMRARGLRVVCRGVEKLGEAELGEGGTFLWWPLMGPSLNEPWVRQLATMLARIGRKATVYVAHDTANPYDMDAGAPREAVRGDVDRPHLRRGRPRWPAPSPTISSAARPLGRLPHGARRRPALRRRQIAARGGDRRGRNHRPRPPRRAERAGARRLRETTTNNAGHCARDREGVGDAGMLGIKTLDDCVNFCYERCRNCCVVSFSEGE